jgi:hypothetical protein
MALESGEPGVYVLAWHEQRPGEKLHTVMAERDPPSRFDKACVLMKSLQGPVKTNAFTTVEEVLRFMKAEAQEWLAYLAAKEETRQ